MSSPGAPVRPRLTLAVSLAGAAGYVAAGGRPEPAPLILLIVGLALLVAGCTLLNQLQERASDARMARTRNRPLARGRLAPSRALALSLALTSGGLVLLATGGGARPALLGLLGGLLYNGLYTRLKRRSSLALLAGALAGALPPLVGWSAAGGRLATAEALWLPALLALWQVPHFWSRHLPAARDYRRAGLALFPRWHPVIWRRVTRVWVLALALATPGLAAFGPCQASVTRLLLLACPLFLLPALGAGAAASARDWNARLDRGLHLYLAALLVLLAADPLLRHALVPLVP